MRVLICFILNIMLVLPALAQQEHDKHKRIEALKASFITQKLDLTPSESQKFWPVYNEYQKQLTSFYRQKRANRMENKDNPNAALNNDLNLDAKILSLRKSYQKEFAKVLPAEKVLALAEAEREFREQLIKELRERRQENH